MLYKFEDLALCVNLHKPKEEWDVISCIESVPESTDHEDPKLGYASASEGWSLVYAFSEPLLDCNVPVGDFISDVFVRFDDHGTASVDELELLPVITDSTGMNACNTQLPAKVIFEANESDT